MWHMSHIAHLIYNSQWDRQWLPSQESGEGETLSIVNRNPSAVLLSFTARDRPVTFESPSSPWSLELPR